MPPFVEIAAMDDRQDEKIIKKFGKRLKNLREERGLSLRELAHRADMSHQNIHTIEKGETNPSLTTVCRLADALEVKPADLLQ